MLRCLLRLVSTCNLFYCWCAGVSDAELLQRLTAVRGIGPWTVDMVSLEAAHAVLVHWSGMLGNVCWNQSAGICVPQMISGIGDLFAICLHCF